MLPTNKAKQISSKKCSTCGIRKPLSAFIVRPISHIKQYGSICSSCRNKSAQTWLKKINRPSKKSKNNTAKPISIDHYYQTEKVVEKKTSSKITNKTTRKIDDLFKKSSAAWAKILLKEDDDDDGGSGGKKRSFGVDYYSKRYAIHQQGQKYASLKSAHKQTVSKRDSLTSNKTKTTQSASDKQARKTMKK